MIFIAILLLAQQVSGTTMPIIRSSRVLYRWLLPVVFGASAARKPDTQPSAPHHTDTLKTKAPNTTGSNHLYNTLELLMMGIVVPKTCWASSKICNKNHLLHLVGILFPHINGLFRFSHCVVKVCSVVMEECAACIFRENKSSSSECWVGKAHSIKTSISEHQLEK